MGSVSLAQNKQENAKTQAYFPAHLLQVYNSPSFHWLSTEGPLLMQPKVRFSTKLGFLYNYPIIPYIYVQTGLFYQYTNEGFKVEGAELTYPYGRDNKEILNNFNQGDVAYLYSRDMHSQYLGWPMGLRFQTRDWGVWHFFGDLGLQHVFCLNASATDKISFEGPNGTLTPPTYSENLKVTSFWKVYNLEWYIHVGFSFNMLDRLDFFSSVGYYGGFLNVYNDGKFEINPVSKINLSTNGVEWVIGLSYRLFWKKS
jgi:hypothetical protein